MNKRNVFWAIPFIFVGIVWFLKNMGIVTQELFSILISWQVLVMYIGIYNLFGRHFWGGIITFAVGAVFLLPEIGLLDSHWLHVYWPLIFIFIGVFQLIKPKRRYNDAFRRKHFHHMHGRGDWRKGQNMYSNTDYSSNDGFVVSNNTFGSIQQIVVDPVFKGADIRNTCGGTVLDLRRTKLEAAQTFIDVECTFGGIEIYMPAEWNLQSQVSAVIGGCDDKRYQSSANIDQEHVLVVRGRITFGGIEFKS